MCFGLLPPAVYCVETTLKACDAIGAQSQAAIPARPAKVALQCNTDTGAWAIAAHSISPHRQ